MSHPRDILLGAQAAAGMLPVCDHYSGVEERMRKSLQLQAEMSEEFGTCVFDVTLDCEAGAPVGGEEAHARLVTELVMSAPDGARVGVRVQPVDDVARAEKALVAAYPKGLPLQVLIESPGAVHRAFDIAAHPRVQSLSFGLMDFVSAHGGAIPAEGMGLEGQFTHPLVLRAKLDIASAAHAFGKVPSHCVVTEFRNLEAIRTAARRAAREFGYTRMWSIHPSQIRPILEAFSPDEQQIDTASAILLAAAKADWAPISHQGALHDRASYRHFWQVLERAHATGRPLPSEVAPWF